MDECSGKRLMTTSEIETPRPRRNSDEDCFQRAKARGQDTFTVVAQDYTAPDVVCEWIKLNIWTAPEDKLFAALARAIRMRDFPFHKKAD